MDISEIINVRDLCEEDLEEGQTVWRLGGHEDGEAHVHLTEECHYLQRANKQIDWKEVKTIDLGDANDGLRVCLPCYRGITRPPKPSEVTATTTVYKTNNSSNPDLHLHEDCPEIRAHDPREIQLGAFPKAHQKWCNSCGLEEPAKVRE